MMHLKLPIDDRESADEPAVRCQKIGRNEFRGARQGRPPTTVELNWGDVPGCLMSLWGQPRRSDETSGMSALRLIAAECCTAIAGAPGQNLPQAYLGLFPHSPDRDRLPAMQLDR
jgi:hypothetical protein